MYISKEEAEDICQAIGILAICPFLWARKTIENSRPFQKIKERKLIREQEAAREAILHPPSTIGKELKKIAGNIKEGLVFKTLPYKKETLLNTSRTFSKVRFLKTQQKYCIFEQDFNEKSKDILVEIYDKDLKLIPVQTSEYIIRDIFEMPFQRVICFTDSIGEGGTDSVLICKFKDNSLEVEDIIKDVGKGGNFFTFNDGAIIYITRDKFTVFDYSIFINGKEVSKKINLTEEDIAKEKNCVSANEIHPEKVTLKYQKLSEVKIDFLLHPIDLIDIPDANEFAILTKEGGVLFYNRMEFELVSTLQFIPEDYGFERGKVYHFYGINYLGGGAITVTGSEGLIWFINLADYSSSAEIRNIGRDIYKMVPFSDRRIFSIESEYKTGDFFKRSFEEPTVLQWEFNEGNLSFVGNMFHTYFKGEIICFEQMSDGNIVFAVKNSNEILKWHLNK